VNIFVEKFFGEKFFVRLLLVIIALGWSLYGRYYKNLNRFILNQLLKLILFLASVSFLSASHLANRQALAVYPLFLFYSVIGWMVLIT
jgi:hypothetical protein